MIERRLVALDTHILIYSEGLNDWRRRDGAVDILARVGAEGIVVPGQVLGELFSALVRKFGHTPSQAGMRVLRWRERFRLQPADEAAYDDAFRLASLHGLQMWDALVLATAARAGCRLLLSEDLQDGFVWQGTTVAHPFAEARHPLLADLLAG